MATDEAAHSEAPPEEGELNEVCLSESKRSQVTKVCCTEDCALMQEAPLVWATCLDMTQVGTRNHTFGCFLSTYCIGASVHLHRPKPPSAAARGAQSVSTVTFLPAWILSISGDSIFKQCMVYISFPIARPSTVPSVPRR